MRTPTLRHSALDTLAAALLALALVGCGDALTSSAPAGSALALNLRLRADVMGGPTEAFARVDAAHVVVNQASKLLLDTVATFRASGDGRLALDVRLPDPSATVTVTVELLGSGRVLFSGSGSASAQRGATVTIPLSITPVVAGLAAPDSVALTALGDTVRLRGLPLFASGDTVPNVLAAWAGDGGSIIRVGSDGLVTALREGQGTATASYQTFTRATRVRVQAVVARILLSADTFSLIVDSTRTLTAVARDRNGSQLQRTFGWSSSSSSVATVDASGVVKGVAPGTATITARSEAQSASATVTVRLTPVASVSVLPIRATVLPGDTVRLVATLLDLGGRVLTGRSVTWTSDNPAIATVDSGGLVTGVAQGSATISATSEGKSGSAALQVVQPKVATGSAAVGFYLMVDGSPMTQTVAVTNGGTGTLSGLKLSVAFAGTGGWLAASLGSTTAPTTLTLTANPVPLSAGTYYATVTVSSSVRGADSVAISVQMVVQNSGPAIGISPGAITLHMPWDTASVAISNTGGGSLTGLSASVTGQSGLGCPVGTTTWLSAWVSPTSAPARLSVNASGTGSPGLGCSAVVTVRSTVPGVSPATLSVTYQ